MMPKFKSYDKSWRYAYARSYAVGGWCVFWVTKKDTSADGVGGIREGVDIQV